MTADCQRLCIYSEPDENSEIVCEVDSIIGLIISVGESRGDYYRVYTVYGAPGYCRKEQVHIIE